MTPGVDGDLMIVHILIDNNFGPADDPCTDEKESGFDTRCDAGGNVTIRWKRVEIGE